MKTYFTVLILAVFTLFANAQSKIDTLRNLKVIKLSKKLPPSVIINMIQTGYTMFDVSTDAILKLSDSGVSPDVINAMMQANTKTQANVAGQKDMNDPRTMRRTGIYFYDPTDNERPIRRVDPTVVSSAKSGGFGTFVAQTYTYGIANNKSKSELAGSSSRMQINNPSPTFYFYFENNANPKADDWFFASATSPNEFVFVKLKVKSDSREMVVGTSNAYGASSGISNKIKIDFQYDEIADGVFKVTFKQPLEQGEYCFLYASATPTQYANNKVWDVGIPNGVAPTQDKSDIRRSHPAPPNPLSIFKKKSNNDTSKSKADTVKNTN